MTGGRAATAPDAGAGHGRLAGGACARLAHWLACALGGLLLGLSACGGPEGEPTEASAVREELQQALTSDAAHEPEPPAWVRQLDQGVAASGGVPGEWRVARAPALDPDYDSDAMERVRRLIYRVSFRVPPAFRQRRTLLGAHRAELQVDVARRRVRARFVGPGWPVPDGAEVRLRDDMDGVYLFDGEGGRWLAPGRLATWFEGRLEGRSRSRIRVRRDYKPIPNDGPGLLACALLAEWTGQPRDLLQGRCRGNVLPPGFRFGPWSADLTAVVPMELPRRQLRADHIDPPSRPAPSAGRFLVTAAELERLPPYRSLESASNEAESASGGAPTSADTAAALVVHNHRDTRVILMVEGVPAAIVDARRTARLVGLSPGSYRIGAMRPFGVFVRADRPVTVPGELVLGTPPPAADPDRG